MIYVLFILAVVILFARRIPNGRVAFATLSGMIVTLIILWGYYFTWGNPSGDPHGSMFRGVEWIILMTVTSLFALAAWFLTHRKEP
jgi:O-antigen/teichoic acid export membrane protein